MISNIHCTWLDIPLQNFFLSWLLSRFITQGTALWRLDKYDLFSPCSFENFGTEQDYVTAPILRHVLFCNKQTSFGVAGCRRHQIPVFFLLQESQWLHWEDASFRWNQIFVWCMGLRVFGLSLQNGKNWWPRQGRVHILVSCDLYKVHIWTNVPCQSTDKVDNPVTLNVPMLGAVFEADLHVGC